MIAAKDATRPTASPSRAQRVHFVLPAYNEEPRLARLLVRIDLAMTEGKLPYRVILVDDGSTDGTGAVARDWSQRAPVDVETHARNMGLGATVRDGIRAALAGAMDEDVVITMDADDTHSPGLAVRMAQMINEGHDVVIASRYQPGARIVGLKALRRLLSFGAASLFTFLIPTPGVRDFTCGYRAYRAEVLRWGFETYGPTFIDDQDGFQCMVEILLKLRRGPWVFGEVPLVLRYDRKQGPSKMRVLPTVRNTLVLLMKGRLGLRSQLQDPEPRK